MSKRTKIFLLAALLLILIPAGSLLFFFVWNDAPLIHGEIACSVPYKKDRVLDIYYPTAVPEGKSPVALFIHGGAWITGSKESININRFNGAVNQLRDHGYTVISPEYTLARDNKSPFPECIQDGFDVINWIHQNADSLNLDMDYFGIIGESAGAHIAMMNAYAQPEDFGRTYAKTALDFVVNVYGPNDLLDLYHSNTIDSVERVLAGLPDFLHKRLDLPQMIFGFDPSHDTAAVKAFTSKYSPINYLNEETPPTLIIHGTEDLLVPVNQSKLLHQKLNELQVDNEWYELPKVNHAFVGASDSTKSKIQDWIFNFIESRRKQP